jgi:hypothetical protein
MSGAAEVGPLWVRWEFSDPVDRAVLANVALRGYRGIVLPEPIRVARSEPESSVRLVTLLREAAGCGLRVSWTGSIGDLPRERLRHLSPPRSGTGEHAWRMPGPAGLTIQYGPGFAIVEDRRHGPRRRTVVKDRPTLDLLRECAAPDGGCATSYRPDVRGTALAQQLLLDLGDRLVTLPMHVTLRHAAKDGMPTQQEQDGGIDVSTT